jgi:hypothetical protein
VIALVEKGRMRKITGVKTKELMLWLSVRFISQRPRRRRSP